MLIDINMKFLDILNRFQVTERTRFYDGSSSKGNNSKLINARFMVLMFCMYDNVDCYEYEQEAHGPRFAHLSDIATADMQMLCNIFPIISSQQMKISSVEQFLV